MLLVSPWFELAVVPAACTAGRTIGVPETSVAGLRRTQLMDETNAAPKRSQQL